MKFAQLRCRSFLVFGFSSRQINCPFHIKIRCTRDGQKLYIKDFNSNHNHGTTEQDAVLSRSRTRHYWPHNPQPTSIPSPQNLQDVSPVASKTKSSMGTSIVSKDSPRQVSFPIMPDQVLPRDPVLFQLLSSPQPSSLTFQNLFFVPKNGGGSGGANNNSVSAPPTVVAQPNTNPSAAGGDIKDEQTESMECESFLEPECILQYDDDKCFVPSECLKDCAADSTGDNGESKSGVVLQALKAVLNGERKVGSIDGLCQGSGPAADRFLVRRSDLEEMTRFCSRCGSKVAERRSHDDDKDSSLTVKSICGRGHHVEWRFERPAS